MIIAPRRTGVMSVDARSEATRLSEVKIGR